MPKVASEPSGEQPLVRDLLESDSRYFESDAARESLDGAWLAWMPEFRDLPVGCVVHRVDPAVETENVASWLRGVEHRLWRLGCARPRLYLQVPSPILESTLRLRGYRPRVEHGLLLSRPEPFSSSRTSLRPIVTDADWSAKLRLHEQCDLASDGHPAHPEAWVEMERAKSREGYLRLYLIEFGSRVVGAVGTAECGGILRLKNLIVHPSVRRRGIAVEAIRLVGAIAAKQGRPAMGCFAIAGGPAEPAYRRCGLEIVTRQTEWLRPEPLGKTPGPEAQ